MKYCQRFKFHCVAYIPYKFISNNMVILHSLKITLEHSSLFISLCYIPIGTRVHHYYCLMKTIQVAHYNTVKCNYGMSVQQVRSSIQGSIKYYVIHLQLYSNSIKSCLVIKYINDLITYVIRRIHLNYHNIYFISDIGKYYTYHIKYT